MDPSRSGHGRERLANLKEDVMKRLLLVLPGLLALAAPPALPQEPPPTQETKEEETVRRTEEVVVVSASKTETTLINAPATMTVVAADAIATSPAQNYGDLLRSTPGLNVIQTSARDINMTSRQSTSTLTNSQLVLLDGRSIYLDFFGLVLWDFVPQGPSEIKQIEVVRGPASAVWGANALTGVVNIITKTPRDAEGFNLNLQGGLFNRGEGSRKDDGSGYLYGANFSFAQAPNERVAWRLSAGYFNSDPFSRPVGIVPLDCHPLGVVPCRNAAGQAVAGGFPTGGAPYPADQAGRGSFENDGTSQPKVDLRVDQELGEGGSGGRITYQGGFAGTTGIVHTGIGPFRLESGSNLSYGKIQWTRNALKVGVFGNFTDAEAPNLLLTDPDTGQPVALNFRTQTYDFEFGNSNVVGGKHILSYGGNYRRNNFDITLTPNSEDRNEFGLYFQEEFFTDRFRLAAGVRADKFGNIEDWVFSPRVSLMFKPGARHSIRVSYNRAFRSPSVVNNYLDQDIFSPSTVDLRPLGAVVPALKPLIPNEPFFLRVKNKGSEEVTPRYNLKEESLDAYELAYTGSAGNTTFGIAVYLNRQDDNINFTQLTPTSEYPQGLPGLTFYSPANPATGVGAVTGRPYTLSPILMGALAQIPPPFGPILLPETVATYLNLGPIENKGVEVSIDHSFSTELSAYANYSFQDTPEIKEQDSDQIRYPVNEVGIPAKNRFNVGLNWNSKRYLGSLSLNYSDKAFWTDVLSAPYHGYTDSYALLNASFGIKWADGKVVTSVKGTNLTNETIQQHVYGDILKISAAFEVRIYTK
jgi:outer membrane receptor protein involved in Fe transport